MILLDTHILIWLMEAPQRLSAGERRVLEEAQHSTCVSVASLWELRIKWEKLDARGERRGAIDPAIALDFVKAREMIVAPLDAATAVASLDPPIIHADPFDELLLIHAQQLGARLLTRDAKLRGHPLALQP